MGRTTRFAWLTSLAADISPWAVSSLGFLWAYIGKFGFPGTAILPHLQLIATLWLLSCGTRLLILRIPARPGLVNALAALPTALVLSSLVAGYATILLGLASWRRVVNLQLLSTYTRQWQPTLQALDIPLWQPLAIAGIGFIAIWFLSAWLWNGREWLRSVAMAPASRHGLLPAAGCLLIGMALLSQYAISPPLLQEEPFSKVLFQSSTDDSGLQSHSRIGTEALDAREQAERSRYRANPQARKRNIVLIVSDALRADRMPWTSYPRPVTPFLEALTERLPNAHVDAMRSACGESSCGLLALITSRYVHATPRAPITLLDVLRMHGYRTGMVLSGDHTNFYGLKERYGRLDDYFDGSMQARRYVNDDLLVLDHVATMPSRPTGQPAFLQFHLMSTHGLGKRHPQANRYLPAQNYYRRWLLEGRSEAFRARATNYYDDGVLQFDETLKQLVDMLARKGYLDDALLVITGDHGDQLGEHDMYAHANSTWEPVLRIPLVIVDFGAGLPALPPQPITSQVDIAPTLLRALDMPIPSTWQGIPLQSPQPGRLLYFQEGFATGLYDTYVPGTIYKYWRDWHAGEEHVYDIATDPNEARDLAAEIYPRQLARWRAAVLGHVAASGIDTTQHMR